MRKVRLLGMALALVLAVWAAQPLVAVPRYCMAYDSFGCIGQEGQIISCVWPNNLPGQCQCMGEIWWCF